MVDANTIRFTLSTQAIAPFVFLTVRGDHRGFFSDNGFIQVKCDTQMTYYSENGITPQQFTDRIKVMSLFDVTAVAEDFGRPVYQRRSLAFNNPEYSHYDLSEENDVHSSYILYNDWFA